MIEKERNLSNGGSDVLARLLQGIFGIIPGEVRNIVLSLGGADHQHLLEFDFFLGFFNKLEVNTSNSLCGLLDNTFGLGGERKGKRGEGND